jgi:zinc transport system substrate-binding protein
MRSPCRLAAATALTAALAAGAATGCSGGDASDDRFTVVAAFYPLRFLAEQLAGAEADVVDLVKPGAEPHDLELTPDQVATLADADLVIYLKGFQPAVDEAVDQQVDPTRVLDVAAVRPLLTGPAGQPDPHLWLDPTRYAGVAGAVAGRLAQADPAHRANHRAHADTLTEDLAGLDGEYTVGLRDCKRRDIVVSHAAYGYLAVRYRLEQVAISGLSPEEEPTPQRLAEVADIARAHHATVVFFETLVSPKIAEALANEVGAEAEVLDPLEGLRQGSRDDYFSVMRRNLDTLRAALDCR